MTQIKSVQYPMTEKVSMCDYFSPDENKTSIFIPRFPQHLFGVGMPPIETIVFEICGNIGLFNVRRIDISTDRLGYITAFVHFHTWQKTTAVICIRDLMDISGYYQVSLYNGGFVRLFYNKNPITDSEILIPKSPSEIYEEKIKDLETVISTQDDQIQQLKKKVIEMGKEKMELRKMFDEIKCVSSLQSDFASQIIKLADENKKGKYMCSIPSLPDWCYGDSL